MTSIQRVPWLMFLVMLVLGFLLATQLRVQQRAQVIADLLQRPEQLFARVRTAEEKVSALERENTELRRLLAEHRLQAVPDVGTLILAGSAELQGPGIIVRVEQAAASPGGRQAALNQIQDEDLLRITNELFAAGAEAVAVNGQRLVAISELRSVGVQVVVNGTPLAPPFALAAIGDPAVLEASLRIRGGVVDALSAWGVRVTVQHVERVQIPAFRRKVPFRFAQPLATELNAP